MLFSFGTSTLFRQASLKDIVGSYSGLSPALFRDHTSCATFCLSRDEKLGVAVVALLKPNSITLASLELAPNTFGASSELVQS